MGDPTKYIYGPGSTTEWQQKVQAIGNEIASHEDEIAELYTLVGNVPGTNPNPFDTRNYITTGGTATAFTVTFVAPYIAQPEGLKLRLNLHTTAGDDAILSLDGMVSRFLAWPDGTKVKAADGLIGYIEVVVDTGGRWRIVSPAPTPLPQAPQGLKSVQVFTASGAWTKPAGITGVRVQVCAGGGGGGIGTKPAGATPGGGGGAGGYAEEFIDVTGTASVTVTVGAGGATEVAGGSSSFGAFCSATGGGAGIGPAKGVGGVGSGGNINISGTDGGNGSTNQSGPGIPGGGSYFGGSGGIRVTEGVGDAAVVIGAGGSGGFDINNGGAGKSGIVIVWEYA